MIYYELPLKLDKYYHADVWTNDNHAALTFPHDIKRGYVQRIVNSINGDSDEKFPKLTFTETRFYDNGKFVFHVRGWGRLVGTGGFGMELDDALKVQNAFRDFIFKKLTDHGY